MTCVFSFSMKTFFGLLLEVWYLLQLFWKLARVAQNKSIPTALRSAPLAPWLEPATLGSTRILWGYWDKGVDKLPGFCQIAVRSWAKQHPGWLIVILDDSNFRTYVAHGDVPSTFFSLKPQSRSDILRAAVLARHGGAYFDVSTICLRSLEPWWDHGRCGGGDGGGGGGVASLLVSAPIISSTGLCVVNATPLMAREAGLPPLREWVRRAVAYAEKPCASLAEMRSHPEFARVAPLFDDPNLGLLKNTLPYLSFVWILHDILANDPAQRDFVSKNVYLISTWENTFGFFSLPSPPADRVPRWSYTELGWRILQSVYLFRRNDEALFADIMRRKVNMFKISSDSMVDWCLSADALLNVPTTMGRLLRQGVLTQCSLNPLPQTMDFDTAQPFPWHGKVESL